MLNDQEKEDLKRKWLTTAEFFHCPPSKPSPPKMGCVYAFEMGDSTVKIGVSEDVDQRKLSVQSAKCQDVLRIHSTGFAPYRFMTKLEKRCHAAFAERRVRGEYFNITFEEAIAELDSHADEIAAAFNAADQRFLDEVTFYFNEFLPEYEKARATLPDEEEPEYFFTYIVKLSNGKTRIGVASNFNEELERIMDETGLDIVDFHTTPFMSYLDAWHLKEHCKRLFLASDMTGEFYSADFPEVKAAILAEDKVNKLLALANILPDSEEKTRLVLQAASLI